MTLITRNLSIIKHLAKETSEPMARMLNGKVCDNRQVSGDKLTSGKRKSPNGRPSFTSGTSSMATFVRIGRF